MIKLVRAATIIAAVAVLATPPAQAQKNAMAAKAPELTVRPIEDVFTLLDQSIANREHFSGYRWGELYEVRESLKRAILFVFHQAWNDVPPDAAQFYERIAAHCDPVVIAAASQPPRMGSAADRPARRAGNLGGLFVGNQSGSSRLNPDGLYLSDCYEKRKRSCPLTKTMSRER